MKYTQVFCLHFWGGDCFTFPLFLIRFSEEREPLEKVDKRRKILGNFLKFMRGEIIVFILCLIHIKQLIDGNPKKGPKTKKEKKKKSKRLQMQLNMEKLYNG